MTQRAVHRHFGLNPNESIPDRKTILKWVQNLSATGSEYSLKKQLGVPNPWTHENIHTQSVNRAVSDAFFWETCLYASDIDSNGDSNFAL